MFIKFATQTKQTEEYLLMWSYKLNISITTSSGPREVYNKRYSIRISKLVFLNSVKLLYRLVVVIMNATFTVLPNISS